MRLQPDIAAAAAVLLAQDCARPALGIRTTNTGSLNFYDSFYGGIFSPDVRGYCPPRNRARPGWRAEARRRAYKELAYRRRRNRRHQ
jgi:hypothetical protein